MTESAETREGDDYDLMTYGEAAARLAELIAEEKASLAALEAAAADEAEISRLRARIELLESSNERYRQQSLSAEAFTQRFGFKPVAAGKW